MENKHKLLSINYKYIRDNPSMVLLMGFITVILAGATLLNFPFASVDGKSIGFVDALFTASSAVCVTGLSVVNTATHWTGIGKIIILIMIQIGGLGVMTMSSFIVFFLGKKISLKTRLLIRAERNSDGLSGVVRITKNVLIFTFVAELIGAILLTSVFIKEYDLLTSIKFAVFHSISAFCNAGFDILGEVSLGDYVTNPVINITIMGLIILGGLGYYVFVEIINHRKIKHFSLHSKISLITTGILILAGAILFWVIEHNNPGTMNDYSFFEKIQISFFQSVTTRTAGFSTIDIGSMEQSTAFMMIMLMFVGGCSASTAGGIKVTTLAVFVLSIKNTITGKDQIEINKKSISNEVVQKATAIIGIGFIVVLGDALLLNTLGLSKIHSFLDVLFEAVSSFATVGLTRNLTPDLNNFGRILLSFTMLIGRVGPLTIAMAITKRTRNYNGHYKCPEGRVIVG